MKLAASGSTASFTMFSSDWRKPLNISVGLHLIILALAVLTPNLFDRQPRLPEIYTVNLYTATEISEPAPQSSSPAKTAAKPAVETIEPENTKPPVSIQPPEPEVVAVAPTTITKPVSLAPLKQKIKIGKTKEEEAVDKARLSRIVERLKAGAAHKEARNEADKAAKDAVSKLADAIKTTSAATAGSTGKTTAQTSAAAQSAGVSGPRGTGVEPDFYMKQYLSAVYQKIHDHWVLPDLQNWDDSLEAILVISIRRDGTVTNTFFESKSENIYFNQFVLKAVKDASPLPPFPDQLSEDAFEIGLRFKPGELY